MPGKKTTYVKTRYYLNGIEKFHPFQNLVYLINLISSIVLAFLIFSFELKIASKEGALQTLNVPDVFLISTLVLFATLIFTNNQSYFFKEERIGKLKRNYYLVLFLGTVFIVVQMAAVYVFQLTETNKLSEDLNSFFILLISYHLIHLVICMLFLIMLLFRVVNSSEDPVKTLVYITNPYEKLLIKLKNIAWNYQVAVWVALFLYFSFRF